jgi:hypothetical protein
MSADPACRGRSKSITVAGAVVDGGRVVVVLPRVVGVVVGVVRAGCVGGGVVTAELAGGAAATEVAVGGPPSAVEVSTIAAASPVDSVSGADVGSAAVSPGAGSVLAPGCTVAGITIGTWSSTYPVTTVGRTSVDVVAAAAETALTDARPARRTPRLRPTATTTTTTRLSPETAAAVTLLRFTNPPSVQGASGARSGTAVQIPNANQTVTELQSGVTLQNEVWRKFKVRGGPSIGAHGGDRQSSS